MILLIFMITSIFFICLYLWRNKNLPPGPFGLPYFGYSLFLEYPLFKSIHELGKIYGKLFSFTAFGRTVIVINDYNIIKKCLVNRREFSGRTTLFVNGLLAEKHGISNYDGKLVEVKKGFMNNFLKMTPDIESIIEAEATYLMEYIHQLSNKNVNPRFLFNKVISNVIWKVVFGKRFDYSTSKTASKVENVAENNTANDVISFQQFLPTALAPLVHEVLFLRKVLKISEIFNRYRDILEFISSSVRQLKDEKEITPFDFAVESENIKMSEKESTRLIFEIFAAGTDTVIITMAWTMMLLAIHPLEQMKIRKEINQILIPEKNGKVFITWSDRNKLRYCQQVIAEIHRCVSVTALPLPHRVTKSCTLENYNIPVNSVVLIGSYSIHNDSEIWDDPKRFNPERFNNKSLTDHMLPFLIGARSCPGAMIAQAEIFTMLLNIVNNFEIIPVKKDLSFENIGIGSPGLTRSPNYHEVIFKPI